MQKVCKVLEDMVRERVVTTYAIGGATAAGFHGEPLATRDVDVFVFLDSEPGSLLVTLQPIYRSLAAMGFSEFEKEAVMIDGLPTQFISAATDLEREAVEGALCVEWEGGRMRVMRPEHLAAIALSVGRPKDRARVVYLWSLPKFDRMFFAEILSRYDLVDVWKNWSKGLGLEEKAE